MSEQTPEHPDFLRDKLFHYEENPPSGAWSRLERDLPPPRKGRRRLFAWFFLVAGLAGGLAGWWWTASRTPSSYRKETARISPSVLEEKNPVGVEEKNPPRSGKEIDPAPAVSPKEEPGAKSQEKKTVEPGRRVSPISQRVPHTAGSSRAELGLDSAEGIRKMPERANPGTFPTKSRRYRGKRNASLFDVAIGNTQGKGRRVRQAYEQVKKAPGSPESEMPPWGKASVAGAVSPSGLKQTEGSLAETSLPPSPSSPATGKSDAPEVALPPGQVQSSLPATPLHLPDSISGTDTAVLVTGPATHPDSIPTPPDSGSRPQPQPKPRRWTLQFGVFGVNQTIRANRQESEYQQAQVNRYQNIRCSPMLELAVFRQVSVWKPVHLRMGAGISAWQMQMRVLRQPGWEAEGEWSDNFGPAGPVFSFSPQSGLSEDRRQTWLRPWLGLTLDWMPASGFPGLRLGVQGSRQWGLEKAMGASGQKTLFQADVLAGLWYQTRRMEMELRVIRQPQSRYALPGVSDSRSDRFWIGAVWGYRF